VAKANFVPVFMQEWQTYAEQLARGSNHGDGRFGQDLTEEVIASMNEEQRASLERLRQEATNFRPSN